MKRRGFVVWMHSKPENCSKSLEFFFNVYKSLLVQLALHMRKNPRIMTSSNFGLKIDALAQSRMSRKAYSRGRRAYGLTSAGASKPIEILTSSNELVIPSFMQDGIYLYCLN